MKCERCGSLLHDNYPYVKTIYGRNFIICSHCKQWHEKVLDFVAKKCDGADFLLLQKKG